MDSIVALFLIVARRYGAVANVTAWGRVAQDRLYRLSMVSLSSSFAQCYGSLFPPPGTRGKRFNNK